MCTDFHVNLWSRSNLMVVVVVAGRRFSEVLSHPKSRSHNYRTPLSLSSFLASQYIAICFLHLYPLGLGASGPTITASTPNGGLTSGGPRSVDVASGATSGTGQRSAMVTDPLWVIPDTRQSCVLTPVTCRPSDLANQPVVLHWW